MFQECHEQSKANFLENNVSVGSQLVINKGSKWTQTLSLINQGAESNVKADILGSCTCSPVGSRTAIGDYYPFLPSSEAGQAFQCPQGPQEYNSGGCAQWLEC